MKNINHISDLSSTNLTFFNDLSQIGFSLIRLHGKTPIETNWPQWCETHRAFTEIGFQSGENAGIACGPASGILVIDVDDLELFASACQASNWSLPGTYTVETGSGGHHYYYRYPNDGRDYGNRAFKQWGFDIRGRGGQVVAPGSIHPDTGRPYRVHIDSQIRPAPEWLLTLAGNGQNDNEKHLTSYNTTDIPDVDSLPVRDEIKALIKMGKSEGERSEAIMRVVDSLVSVGLSDEKIFMIFETFPIGEKYREKGNSKREWLQAHIGKAKSFVTNQSQEVFQTHDEETDKKNKIEIAFPMEIIDGIAGEFAHLYASQMETPVEFFYISYLTCLGVALSDRLTLATELKPQPRLYVLLLGHSADDRKSTAILKTTEFFKDKIAVCWGIGSAEGLQIKLQNKNKLLLAIDEFRQFASKCNIQASVLLPCVTTLFESNNYESQTKHKNITLNDVHLSLLSASTIETYERTWDPNFTDIGFNNRLFIVPGRSERKFSLPKMIAEEDKKAIQRKIGGIIAYVGESMRLGLTPEAEGEYDDWYMSIEHSIHSRRLDTYALRFMALMAVNNDKKEVDIETVQKVIALMDWQLKVRKFYDPVDADNAMAKMEGKIRKQLEKKPMTDRNLKRSTNAYRAGMWFYQTSKENLKSVGDILFNNETNKWELVQ